MTEKLNYEELEKRVKELEKETVEREQVEKALRKERDRAQQYLDIAGVMIVAINTKGEVTLINKKGCEVCSRIEVVTSADFGKKRDWRFCGN